jgi:hypothetical protein
MLVLGWEWVDQVIASLMAAGGKVKLDWCEKPAKPVPVPPKVLAKLKLPGGNALPPSLRRWLAFDGKAIELFRNVAKGTWHPPMKIAELCEDQFDDRFEEFGEILPGNCFLIPGGTDQRRFLYVGDPDGEGEYPIFTIDPSNMPYLALTAPNIGVYVAAMTGVIEEPRTMEALFDDKRFKASMRAQSKVNFHDWKAAELGGQVLGLDGKRKGWPRAKAPPKPAAPIGKKAARTFALMEAVKQKIDAYKKRTKKSGRDLGHKALEIAAAELGYVDEAISDELAIYTKNDKDYMFGAMYAVRELGSGKIKRKG